MNLPYQHLLLLAVAGFYLGDSLLLLRANEVVLTVAGQYWACACPDGDWQLAGRIPWLPNPFTPHRALFRARFEAPLPLADTACRAALEARALALRALGLPVLLLAVWLFGVLPWVVWHAGTGSTFLRVVLAAYAWILLMMLLVIWRRQALGLDGRAVAALAFDVLACPPFAVNLVRKLSLRQPVPADGVALACSHLDADARAALAVRLGKRLALQITEAPEDSVREHQLLGYLRELAEPEP